MGGVRLQQALDRDVEGIEFIHLCDGPCPLLAVPAHECALMAGLAQGHAGVLAVLLDVVGIRWPGFVADAAGQFFDPGDVSTLLGGQLVVHPILSMVRLEASRGLANSPKCLADPTL